MQKFTGKTIIVTGATSGIGEVLCEQLANHQANLIIVARSLNKLTKLKQRLEDNYQVTCSPYLVDLVDQQAWKETLVGITKEHPSIDALVNNAGFGIFDYAVAMNEEDVERMFQVNVYALMEATAALLPHFSNQHHGHIINVASFAGKIATPKSAVYSATKHAVLGYTNAVRSEVKKDGIYVTAVNLGPVRTRFFQTADPSGQYEKAVKHYMLEPEKVAVKIVAAMFKPRREINLPKWMEFGSRLYLLFPNLTERLMSKTLNKK